MEQRNPTTVCLLGFVTCGIYQIYWSYLVGEELRKRGNDIPPWWMLIIYPLTYLYLWKMSEAVEKVTGGKQQAMMAFLVMALLGPIGAYIVQTKLNEVR